MTEISKQWLSENSSSTGNVPSRDSASPFSLKTKAKPPPRPQNKQILLLLKEGLLKKLKSPLRTRFSVHDIIVPIESDTLEEKDQLKFQWLLRFPWKLPPKNNNPTVDPRKLFRVPGMSNLNPEKVSHHPDQKLKSLITRYNKLRLIINEREKNRAFLKLAQTESIINNKKEEIQNLKAKLDQLDSEMNGLELAYYQAISYIFSTAIEKITGVAVLDGLMKGLVKIMIVDDLGKRTLDGLSDMNYSRKYLFVMNSSELEKKFNDYKEEHADDEDSDINIGEFIFKSPDFAKIDIVFFNRWKFSEEKFMVPVLLRKKKTLSKKEQNKVRTSPEYIQKQIKMEEEGLTEAKDRLKETAKEINRMEKGRYSDETEYQTALNNRRRYNQDIHRREFRIKNLKKPVNNKDKVNIVKFDLYETFKGHQSFMDRLGDKVSDWGLDTLWKKHMNPNYRFSFKTLYKMCEVAQEWIHVKTVYDKKTNFTESLQDQLNEFASKYKLLQKESLIRNAGPGSYQPLIQEHMLDHIEVAAISCEIINLSEKIRNR